MLLEHYIMLIFDQKDVPIWILYLLLPCRFWVKILLVRIFTSFTIVVFIFFSDLLCTKNLFARDCFYHNRVTWDLIDITKSWILRIQFLIVCQNRWISCLRDNYLRLWQIETFFLLFLPFFLTRDIFLTFLIRFRVKLFIFIRIFRYLLIAHLLADLEIESRRYFTGFQRWQEGKHRWAFTANLKLSWSFKMAKFSLAVLASLIGIFL